jgi:hypothetical protein
MAQIDHLLINRFLTIWVCESKHFAEGVGVTEDGEWLAYWHHVPRGMASPLEQLRKHRLVLEDVFRQGLAPIPRHLGIPVKPEIRPLVLVSNRARISRPRLRNSPALDGLDAVIKAEQLKPTIDRHVDRMGLMRATGLQSSFRLKEFAERLAALHRPLQRDWRARFGVPLTPPAISPEPASAAATIAPLTAVRSAAKCVACGTGVSDKVVAYCADNPRRFGDQVFCYRCQRTVNPAVRSPRVLA